MSVDEVPVGTAHRLVVGRAFGTPIEKGGLTLVPVAVVAGGGGAGRGVDDRERHGGGNGFGGIVYPLGVYSIRDGRARFVPTVSVTRIVMVVLFMARLAIRSRMKVTVVKGRPGHRAEQAGTHGR